MCVNRSPESVPEMLSEKKKEKKLKIQHIRCVRKQYSISETPGVPSVSEMLSEKKASRKSGPRMHGVHKSNFHSEKIWPGEQIRTF